MHPIRFKRIKFWFGATAILLVGDFLAIAQEVELPKVVVYDFPDSSVAGRESTSSVTIIDRDEIERSGASDVYELISGRVPGVFVNQRGIFNYGIGTGAAGTLNIRGLGGDPNTQTLVLVDGQPTTMGIFGHPIADAYSLEEVERVEVLRGSHSLHYGNQALGGVVNIVTRTLPEKEGISTRVSAGAGGFHSYKAALENSGRFGKFSYFASLLRRETEGHRPNSGFRGWNGYLKTGYHISDNWQVVASGWGVDFAVEEPGTTFNPQTQDTRDVIRGGGGITFYNTYDGSRGALTVYGQRGKHDFTGDVDDGWKSHDRSNGIRVYQSADLTEDNCLEVGGDIEESGGKGENALTGVDYGRFYETRGGIYLDDEQNLWELLTLQAGLRLELAEHAESEWIPRVGLRYQLFSSTVIHGQVSRGYRAPTIRELYLFAPATLDLEPEEAWNYELGIRQSLGSALSLELTGYYIDADNLIIYSWPQAANTGSVINRGVEFAGTFVPCEWFEMLLSYTYLDQNKRVDQTAANIVSWINRLIWDKLTLQATTAFVQDLRFSDRDENYTVTDLKLSYRITEAIEAIIKVGNVFNENYEETEGYPMPGRWLWGEMAYKF